MADIIFHELFVDTDSEDDDFLRFRESEFNYLEANENTDTNYDLTEADLHEVEREIYKEECDPKKLRAYTIASGLIIYIFCTNSICQLLILMT